MNANRPLEFGFVATASGGPGTSDRQMYRDLIGDVEIGLGLGYGTVWMIEHHFSDYFPTPDPLAFLSHIAGRFPQAGLGTCVLIAPWYNALRLAGSIAQLRLLTDAPIHLGFGRGTAKYEYDRFGIDMEEARVRFIETLRIVRDGLTKDSFTFDGQILSVPKETRLRPKAPLDNLHFYGAIGASPESAQVMADEGLPPICTTIGNLEAQAATLVEWAKRAKSHGFETDVPMPIMINCVIEDSDAEAVRQAQTHIPPFMKAQVDHYEADADHYKDIAGYKAWSNAFSGMKKRCDPVNIPPWCEWQLVGTPDTAARKLQAYIDAGFNTFLLHTATPGVPTGPRRRWLKRFAEEVMPRFTGAPAAFHATAAE